MLWSIGVFSGVAASIESQAKSSMDDGQTFDGSASEVARTGLIVLTLEVKNELNESRVISVQ